MKILLDENFPEGFQKKLSKLGHDVSHINKVKKGMSDKEVFCFAIKEKRVIISNDLDFKSFIKEEHYGIIRFNSNVYDYEVLCLLLIKYDYKEIQNNYIEFRKNGVYFHRKVYSKKGKYKQHHRIPIKV